MIKCPICKGKGKLPPSKNETVNLRMEAAKKLLELNYGVRETQKLLGYKSPRSVQRLKPK